MLTPPGRRVQGTAKRCPDAHRHRHRRRRLRAPPGCRSRSRAHRAAGRPRRPRPEARRVLPGTVFPRQAGVLASAGWASRLEGPLRAHAHVNNICLCRPA